MRNLTLISSPIAALMVIYGWLGIISNTNVVREAVSMPLALAIFLAGLFVIHRAGCYIQLDRGFGRGFEAAASGLVCVLLFFVGPIYLMFTLPTSHMNPVFWLAVAAYGAVWYAVFEPGTRYS
jgi:hypothetical protein